MDNEPLSEVDFRLALAMRRIWKQFGSLAAFHDHLEAEQQKRNKEIYERQQRELSAALNTLRLPKPVNPAQPLSGDGT